MYRRGYPQRGLEPLKETAITVVHPPLEDILEDEKRKSGRRIKVLSLSGRHRLREWWHGVLREHGRYSCYAVILVLPEDRAAYSYFRKCGKELDLLSDQNCLVFALSKSTFRRSSFDETKWQRAVNEQVLEGHSQRFANFYSIDVTQFPAVVFFRDIRSPDHVVVTLKNMTQADITQKMRIIFSLIAEAVDEQKDPLDVLEKNRTKEAFLQQGKVIVSTILIPIASITLEEGLKKLLE